MSSRPRRRRSRQRTNVSASWAVIRYCSPAGPSRRSHKERWLRRQGTLSGRRYGGGNQSSITFVVLEAMPPSSRLRATATATVAERSAMKNTRIASRRRQQSPQRARSAAQPTCRVRCASGPAMVSLWSSPLWRPSPVSALLRSAHRRRRRAAGETRPVTGARGVWVEAAVSNSASAWHPARQQRGRGHQLARQQRLHALVRPPPEQRCTDEGGGRRGCQAVEVAPRAVGVATQDLRRHVLGMKSNDIGGCDRLSSQRTGRCRSRPNFSPGRRGRAARFLA